MLKVQISYYLLQVFGIISFILKPSQNIHLFYFFWLHPPVCGILVLQPEIEPTPPALEGGVFAGLWAKSSSDFLHACVLSCFSRV